MLEALGKLQQARLNFRHQCVWWRLYHFERNGGGKKERKGEERKVAPEAFCNEAYLFLARQVLGLYLRHRLAGL